MLSKTCLIILGFNKVCDFLGSIKFWFSDLYPCFTKLEQIPLMFLCIRCSALLYMSSCVLDSFCVDGTCSWCLNDAKD